MPTDLNLVFGRPRYAGGPLDLVFGEGFVAPVLPSTVTGTSSLGPALVSSGVTFYDNKNPKQVGTSAAAPFQRASADEVLMGAAWTVATRAAGEPAAGWQGASRTEAAPGLPWVQSREVQLQWAVAWAETQTRETLRRVAHQDTIKMHRQAAAPWGEGQAFDRVARAPHQVATPADRLLVVSAIEARALEAMALARHHIARAAGKTLVAPWQLGRVIPPGLSVYVPPGGPGTTPRVIDLNLVFCHPAYTGGPINLVFGRVCGGGAPGALVVIPIRSTYMVENSVTLVRMPAGTEFEAKSFTLDADYKSWTFGWSASLHSSARAHLVRSTVNERVEVQAMVNGQALRLAIDSIGRDRSFPTDRISVGGRGRSAELDEVDLSFSNPAARTAQQLMADVLTVNGASIGWSVDWQIADWLVPAGAWLHQGSYISALRDIAEAAGAYLQPHFTDKVICVLPRYKEAPWDWTALLSPDIELPVEATLLENTEEVIKPAYNRVFVGGVNMGVFGPVDRDGTAGDVLAPQITHALITDAVVHRQRGLAELSDSGLQIHHTIKGLVLPETGIIMPGKVVRYVTEDGPRLGLVRKMNISMSQWPAMHQTIGVETHAE